MQEDVFSVVKSCILEVVPNVNPSAVAPHVSMRDLGASSVDRMEIVTMAMERLRIKVRVADFTDVKNIGQLVEVYSQALAGARE